MFGRNVIIWHEVDVSDVFQFSIDVSDYRGTLLVVQTIDRARDDYITIFNFVFYRLRHVTCVKHVTLFGKLFILSYVYEVMFLLLFLTVCKLFRHLYAKICYMESPPRRRDRLCQLNWMPIFSSRHIIIVVIKLVNIHTSGAYRKWVEIYYH